MMDLDRHGDCGKAAEIGNHLHARNGLDADLYSEACIAVAIAHDHDGKWEPGLELLAQSLAGDRVSERFRPWALSQLGVLRRNYAQNLLTRTCGRVTPAIQALMTESRKNFEFIEQQSKRAATGTKVTFEDHEPELPSPRATSWLTGYA